MNEVVVYAMTSVGKCQMFRLNHLNKTCSRPVIAMLPNYLTQNISNWKN